tara:strand:+ start:49 stop:873 length:825 start_codon:yes stop_codon:yes gene_type:complete
MHVPGHNPYITQGDVPYDALVEYLIDFDLDNDDMISAITGTTNVPLYAGGYQYQGMSPDIMSALGNVFTPSGTQDFNIQDFIQGNVGSQIQNYLASQDLLYSGFGPPTGGGMDWYANDEIWQDQLFQIPSDVNINPNLDESVLAYTNVFDPESLANTLSQLAGVDPTDDLAAIRAGEVKALTPEMIEKTEGQYYEPLEEAKRADLVEQKVKSLGGASTGGFAGSAGRQSGLSGAERLYRGGYEDLIAQIEGMKGQATEDVLDTIYGWQELMTGI